MQVIKKVITGTRRDTYNDGYSVSNVRLSHTRTLVRECFNPFVTAGFPPSILAYINIIKIYKKLIIRMICPNKHDNN